MAGIGNGNVYVYMCDIIIKHEITKSHVTHNNDVNQLINVNHRKTL